MTRDESPRAASVPVASSHLPSFGAGQEAAPVTFAQVAGDTWYEWTVVEVDARSVPGTHGERCLLFSRADCIRRVWDYPADWRTLDATALAILSWSR